MDILVSVPDDLAARFDSEAEFGRRAIEALALEEYRAGRLDRSALRRLLGLATDHELDALLRARSLSPETAADAAASADDLVARFRALAAQQRLGGISIKELISEGRR